MEFLGFTAKFGGGCAGQPVAYWPIFRIQRYGALGEWNLERHALRREALQSFRLIDQSRRNLRHIHLMSERIRPPPQEVCRSRNPGHL